MGNDTIFGGSGNDDGNDILLAVNKPVAEDINVCGGGRDTVYADKADFIADDCEIVRFRFIRPGDTESGCRICGCQRD